MNGSNFKIFQGFHNDRSYAALSPPFEPINIQKYLGNPYYEFAIMRDLHAANRDIPWGLVSWKFNVKTAVDAATFHRFVEQNLSDHDVVFINPMIFWESIALNVWQQGEAAHPGIVSMTNYLTGISDLDRLIMKWDCFAYCQYFVAQPRFWNAYLDFIQQTIIDPIEANASDDPVISAMKKPAGHHNAPSVGYLPFIIERLFPTFLMQNQQFRVRSYPRDINVYRRKFGLQCGTALYQLSEHKERISQLDDENFTRWSLERDAVLSRFKQLPLPSLDDPPI